MKVGDKVKNLVKLVIHKGNVIPVGSVGYIKFIDPLPDGGRIAINQWHGYYVCFPDYIKNDVPFPCKITEIEGV